MIFDSKVTFKNLLTPCANTYDITTFEVDRVVLKVKKGISQKGNMTFP